MLTLPTISTSELSVMPICWDDLPSDYLNFGELEIIIALIRSVAPEVVVEIGLAHGRTALAILREIPGIEKYIGVDTAPDYRPKIASQRTERSSDPGYLAFDEPAFCRWLLPNGSLDLEPADFPPVCAVFVDGDHSSQVVRHDSDLARAIVRPGGIIIFHDYWNEGVEVTRVLETDFRHGHNIQHVEGTWLAFERVYDSR